MTSIAILIECDPGTTLGGSCFRDVHNMANHLIVNKVMNASNIHLFTTSTPKIKIDGVNYYETIKLLNTLFTDEYDLVIILISGHGYSVSDTNNDEMDGRDEAINIGYTISDDIIYEKFIRGINYKKMIAFSDTCHSGTMFDLPYQLTNDKYVKITKRADEFNNLAISLSACNDNQLSMCDVGENTGFGGSLTTALLNINNCLTNIIKSVLIQDKSLLVDEFNKVQNQLRLLNQTTVLSMTKEL